MKISRKLIGGGLLLPILIGLVIGAHQSAIAPRPSYDPPTKPASPDTTGPGVVIADDETAYSAPKQDNRDAPVSAPIPIATSKNVPSVKKYEKTVVINNKEYPLRTYRTLALPNDPLVSQWWVSQTKLDAAWDIPRGSQQTVLAIIDTGFALGHEEFANRWYTNPGESGPTISQNPSSLNCTAKGLALDASCNLIDDNGDGVVDNETGATTYENPSRRNCTDQSKATTKDCNRIDDDGNGLVDDLTGWDFMNFDNSVQAGELNPSGSGTTHGTLVAGIAAANGNNGKGIAGVDWETKILPIQALDDDSYGDTLSVGRSIFYAVEQGADVISISLGSDLSDSYVREAVQAALEAGIVVVAASGNDGCDCMVYPANYPEVLAVGALNKINERASFSSYGQNIDILAPGVDMTSPVYTAANPSSAYASGVNGTSFATPMIGGMLTRLLSHQPSATPAQLITAVTENTNRLSLSSSIPHNIFYGFGTLEALKSSQRMTIARSSNHLYSFAPVSKGDQLYPSTPVEIADSNLVQHCESGSVPTTALYELTKPGKGFFSVSKVENQKALEQGYVSKLFAYGCLQQPHDTAATVRTIDLYREFRNIFKTLPQS